MRNGFLGRGTALLLLLGAAGCTFTPGGWFATLEPSLQARFEPRADRDVGAGWQKLNTDYEMKLTRAALTIESIQLQDLGGGGLQFDPANPPAGYSLCHGGHCHHESGRLVSYEEIAAELAQGGAGAMTVVSLPVGAVELLGGTELALECEPGCGLPLAHLRRARATLTSVAFEGLLRDGRATPRIAGEVPWRWEANPPPGTGEPPAIVEGELDIPADREHPPEVTLQLLLRLTARLLDDVDWSAQVTTSGIIDLSESANEAARRQVQQNLSQAELGATVSRAE